MKHVDADSYVRELRARRRRELWAGPGSAVVAVAIVLAVVWLIGGW